MPQLPDRVVPVEFEAFGVALPVAILCGIKLLDLVLQQPLQQGERTREVINQYKRDAEWVRNRIPRYAWLATWKL